MELLYCNVDEKDSSRYKHEEVNFFSNTLGKNGISFPNPFSVGRVGEAGIMSSADEYHSSDTSSLKINERLVVNPLWQYNKYADPRTLTGITANYGRVYYQRINANNPIVYIQPGKPAFYGTDTFFLGDGGKGAQLRNKLLVDVLETDDNDTSYSVNNLIEDLQSHESKLDKGDSSPLKFYDFQPDFGRYSMYVKALCEELAIRVGATQGGNPYKFNYKLINDFRNRFGFLQGAMALANTSTTQAGFIPFRVEKTSEATDTFTNEIGPSSISNQIKGQSENVKEVLFLTGGSGGTAGDGGLLSNIANGIVQGLAGNLAEAVSDNAAAIIKTGGNMLFPDIWRDSKYTKQLSINIKLHSPTGHPVDNFNNILFPIACILGFVLPRQSGSSVYVSPPLIRAYSRGWFGCDMGIIDSVTIRRSQGINDWTIGRMPRTVEVSISIKDLFDTMVMSLTSNAGNDLRIFSQRNTMLRDYLNVLGGIDAFNSHQLSTKFKQAIQKRINSIKTVFDPATYITLVQSLIPRGVLMATSFFDN